MSGNSEFLDRSSILNINVGILGHVDSGKTSLVKSLSTSLSTAALDKNPQSQQRGITLDLGFSSFTLPMPEHLIEEVARQGSQYSQIQFTLVDCPGHASLIRTIIGGAQIIDMILLVIDANKGIQTQTAECIVIGEITTDRLIIVLNKIDTIPEEEREAKIEKVSNRIRKVFASTKFAGAPIVPTAAAVGGEKTAAVSSSNPSDLGVAGSSKPGKLVVSSHGIENLVDLIKSTVRIPGRSYDAPFYYAIDHCFSIKGHGTVLTGTVLSGSISVNQTIEIPHLHLQRKVKSLQMFRKPVKSARQGDRVGICLTNLDAALIERSIAATPASVPLLNKAVCLVKKVRFFRFPCKSNSKFHISIGHMTVIANVMFFGANQLAAIMSTSETTRGSRTYQAIKANEDGETGKDSAGNGGGRNVDHRQEVALNQISALNATYQRSFPAVELLEGPIGTMSGAPGKDPPGTAIPSSSVDGRKEQVGKTAPKRSQGQELQEEPPRRHIGYEYQEELIGAEGLAYGTEPVQWALLQFQQPVYCPLGSLVIGSRLDADTSEHGSSGGSGSTAGAGGVGGATVSSGGNQHCRLAFYGPLKRAFSPGETSGAVSSGPSSSSSIVGGPELEGLRIYSWKQKECEVWSLTDVQQRGMCHEAVVWRLVSGGGSVQPFIGMRIETLQGPSIGTVTSAYGADGKCRVKFSPPARLVVGTKLKFRYQRYLHDRSKRMFQTGLDALREAETLSGDLSAEDNADAGPGAFSEDVVGKSAVSDKRVATAASQRGMNSSSKRAQRGGGGGGKAPSGVDKKDLKSKNKQQEKTAPFEPGAASTTDSSVTATAATATVVEKMDRISRSTVSMRSGTEHIETEQKIASSQLPPPTPIVAPPAQEQGPRAGSPSTFTSKHPSQKAATSSTSHNPAAATGTGTTAPSFNKSAPAIGTAQSSSIVVRQAGDTTAAINDDKNNNDDDVPPELAGEAVQLRCGKIDSLKCELPAGVSERAGAAAPPGKKLFEYAIVSGAFRMEENVRAFCAGAVVIGPAGEKGELIAPFGKLGKCKVRFPAGCGGPELAGVKVYTKPPRP